MAFFVRCDKMRNGWNYGTCHSCQHFKSSVSPKGYKWSCALNSRTMGEKWEFYLVWAEDHLVSHGKLIENLRSRIEIDYVGK